MPEPGCAFHSHQTIRLSKGRHGSPGDGACVMELASMLAGEPFGDHPAAVCKVIAAFLRIYNDGLDDERRQDLYLVASAVVGTGSDAAASERRAAHCATVARSLPSTGCGRLLLRLSRFAAGLDDGAHLARLLLARGEAGHARALALINELVALGEAPPAAGGGEAPRHSHRKPPRQQGRVGRVTADAAGLRPSESEATWLAG